MGGFFSFCLKNVLRGKSRALFCILAVSVGVMSVILLDTVGMGGREVCISYLKSFGFSGSLLIPNSSISKTSPLSAEDEQLCLNTAGVADATAFTTRYGMMRCNNSSRNAVIWGVGENMERFLGTELVSGSYFHKKDISDGASVIIDSETALDYFKTTRAVGRKLQLSLDGNVMEFTVTGVVNQSISLLTALSGGQIPTFVYIPLKGLCLAVGADARQIAAVYLTEAGLLSLFGGILGIALGIGLAGAVCLIINLPFFVSPATVLISLGIVFTLGFFFGTFPAIRASKMCPIDSLRIE